MFRLRRQYISQKRIHFRIICAGNKLAMSGEKKLDGEKKENGYYHVESTYGSFRRELTLTTDVDEEKINAVCKDGVLSVTVPKAKSI